MAETHGRSNDLDKIRTEVIHRRNHDLLFVQSDLLVELAMSDSAPSQLAFPYAYAHSV